MIRIICLFSMLMFPALLLADSERECTAFIADLGNVRVEVSQADQAGKILHNAKVLCSKLLNEEAKLKASPTPEPTEIPKE